MMELLKKWLDGSIKWKEEKQLRNQAKEDPFLADALDGFDALPEIDHTHTINALEQKLQDRIIKKKKPVAYPLRAIAAAALLLLSAGIWWNIQNNLNQSTLAEKQLPPAPASPIMEKAVPKSDADISTSTKIIVENRSKENRNASLKTTPTNELAVVQKELSTTTLSNDQESTAFVQEVAPESSTVPSMAVESVAINPEEAPATQSSIIAMDKTASEVTTNKAESIIAAEAEGIAYIDEAHAARSAPAAMVDERGIHAIAATKSKKSRATKRKLSDTPEVLPVGGMDAFKEYIKTNKVYPEVAKAASIQGTVFLAFSLDKDGTVKDVEVTESLHPACDAEAIRLLQEGPKWISPTGIGYCEISFSLDE